MSEPAVSLEQAETFSRCMSVGGVAVFPADTVYGLACEPAQRDAVERLYALKGRVADKPAAVMFFSVGLALSALPRARAANPRRDRGAAAGRADAAAAQPGAPLPARLRARRRARWACASRRCRRRSRRSPACAGRSCRRAPTSPAGPTRGAWTTFPREIRDGADLVIDGGELPGTASTVLDLRTYELDGSGRCAARGAVAEGEIAARLG